MFFFDPLYFAYALLALLFGLWAQWLVKSAMNRYGKVQNTFRFTGAEIAQRILASSGFQNNR
jgi:Zn-dependent membrane protease YugP